MKYKRNVRLRLRFTTRVTDLIGVLSDVNQGKCVRKGINNTTIESRSGRGQIRTQDGIIK